MNWIDTRYKQKWKAAPGTNIYFYFRIVCHLSRGWPDEVSNCISQSFFVGVWCKGFLSSIHELALWLRELCMNDREANASGATDHQ